MILFDTDFPAQGAVVHLSTKNVSFIRMSAVLREMGIRNNKFFLALHDQTLANIDPHNLTPEQNTLEMHLRIANECKINPWYFLREVVRVPAQGAENSPYILNRANLALSWCFFSNIDVFLTMPRQVGKTIGSQSLVCWLMYISGLNVSFALFAKDSTLQQENVSRLKMIRDGLPSYLLYATTADTDNKEGVSYAQLGTRYRTFTAQSDRESAERQARGGTFAGLHWDEIAYYNNIELAYDGATTTSSEGKMQAHLAGIRCSNIITTTAGRLRSNSGKYAYKIKSECLPFNERIYDMPSYESIIRLMPARRMFYLEYSYKQLGKSQEWFNERTAGKDPAVIATDFLNQWLNDAGDSPLPKAVLDKLATASIEPTIVTFEDSIMLRWYVDPNRLKEKAFYNKPLIIGMDVSDNIGRDSTTFVLTDPSDLSTVATFNCNTTNLTFVTRYIVKLLITFPRSVFIPERNRNGGMLLDTVIVMLRERGINPFKRIYNTVIQEYASTKDPVDINNIDPTHSTIRAHFGFVTTKSATSRDMLYKSTLNMALKHNIARIYDSRIIEEICGLVVRNGRIDHAVEGHDDTLIAYLLTCYFIFYGKELHRYGIGPNEFLSRVADDGSEVDPLDKQRQREYRKQKRLLEDALSQTTSEVMRTQYERQLADINSRIKPGVIDDEIISVAQLTAEAREEGKAATAGIDLHVLSQNQSRSKLWF